MSIGSSLNRRKFLKTAAQSGIGLGVASSMRASRILGANDRINLGLIGSGGRGRFLMKYFQDQGAEVLALCDVYEPHLAAGIKTAGPRAKSCDDYRRLLEDKSLDAVIVATPDHWHGQMAIDAVEAGKDVYVEKPMCHTVDEGFRLIEAVRKSKRVVQIGTQRRSYDLFVEGKKIMESGKLGEVRLIIAWWINAQTSLRRDKLDGKLDWDKWLGPAPHRPQDPLRFFNWYYFYDYGGGMMVGQAAHIVDAIHWFMNSTYPTAVTCSAGKVHLEGAEVPETTVMNVEYPEDYLVTFTVGYKTMHYAWNNDQMKQFHGSKARFDMARESYALYPQSQDEVMVPELQKRQFQTFNNATRDHIANFMDCIRTRKTPNSTVEAGQHTNVVLCMALESLRHGCRVRWDAERQKMIT